MKFALVNDSKQLPAPGVSGECPSCGAEMISKCGNVRVPHWAHRSVKHCDSWWEPETEWHRAWKSEFMVERQEIALRASDGELHIADVHHPETGLALEFQHSAIKPEEAASREAFWRNMAWVVDGLRLKRMRSKFFQDLSRYRLHLNTSRLFMFAVPQEEELVPAIWRQRGAPVFLDFGPGSDPFHPDYEECEHNLWCILFGDPPTHSCVLPVAKETFLSAAREGRITPNPDQLHQTLQKEYQWRMSQARSRGRVRSRF